MIPGAVEARIGQLFKMFDETDLRMFLHPMLFKHISVKYKAKFA